MFDVLLQVLDNSQLTETGPGRTVNPADALVVVASDLGSEYIIKASRKDERS